MDDGSSEDTDTMDERQTVLECQQALADAGALDSAFLVRLTAPDKHVTTEERAVLRFLRATETGAVFPPYPTPPTEFRDKKLRFFSKQCRKPEGIKALFSEAGSLPF